MLCVILLNAIMLSFILLFVIILYIAYWCFAERRYTECRYAESRGAQFPALNLKNTFLWHVDSADFETCSLPTKILNKKSFFRDLKTWHEK